MRRAVVKSHHNQRTHRAEKPEQNGPGLSCVLSPLGHSAAGRTKTAEKPERTEGQEPRGRDRDHGGR